MKIKFSSFLILIFFVNQAWTQSIARVENVKIQSEYLNQEREILIYTPVDYDWRLKEYFNVIYVLDSQSREFFDYTSSIISFLTNNTKSFIVVGITSPYNEKLDYSRNNDLLPVLKTKKSIDRYGEYSGNSDNFFKYVSAEVVPYIDAHYRTLSNRLIIGHSLSASFVLDSFIKNPGLFNSYIAISPNLAYDNQSLANKLINFEYATIEKPTYLYLSNANEGIKYWQEWKPARTKVYAFLQDTLKNEHLSLRIEEFPENNHWNTFPPGLNNALRFYFDNNLDNPPKELSKKEYEVTIRVKVPKAEDTLYITGNQNKLGNWSPDKVLMKKVSEYEREISLKLKSPAQFKFTRGDWGSEAETIGTYGNVTIKPELKKEFEFEIISFFDRIK